MDDLNARLAALLGEHERIPGGMKNLPQCSCGAVVPERTGLLPWHRAHVAAALAEAGVGFVQVAGGSNRPHNDRDGACICDYNPATTDGPQEDCPFHGRPYAYWIERGDELQAALDDLRSRLACVSEATYWDRPYDTRIAAIRGMCDLTTNGLTPARAAAEQTGATP